jgi:hypothetical protein
MNNYKKIETLNELKMLAGGFEPLDCFILLSHGIQSWKIISWDNNTKEFYIRHFIDDSEETLTSKQLVTSNVGIALKKGNLYIEKNHYDELTRKDRLK